MKWGIVDNYQQPKRSYYYVQRAYQPLLVSLQFDRRRWKGDETFKGRLWIVNDTYQNYRDCKIELSIVSELGTNLNKQHVEIDTIDPNSAASFADVSWGIAGQVDDHFIVSLSLIDSQGIEISANQYRLLIGDQQAAREKMKALGKAQSESNNAFTYGNYYRFFPDMVNQNNRDWQSTVQTPQAAGFDAED